MRREQREQQVLVQQTVGLRFHRLADLRTERHEGPHAPRLVDPHPQVDHHEVGIGRQVGRRPVQCACHRSTIHAHCAGPQPRQSTDCIGVRQAPYQDQSGRSHSDLSVWPAHAGDSEQIGPICAPSLDRADKAATVQNGRYRLSSAGQSRSHSVIWSPGRWADGSPNRCAALAWRDRTAGRADRTFLGGSPASRDDRRIMSPAR
jgi:hypothetical protein